MTTLSICIPTYNRAAHLANCLESLISNKPASKSDLQVCISDNGSTDETSSVVSSAQKKMSIEYQRNPANIGIPKNFLKVVEMARGEFVWLIGDDDLLLPDSLDRLYGLINKYLDVDYFYVNSFHLTTQYVFSFPQPFDVLNLPTNMKPFSSWPYSGEMKFMELIHPKISFDFLGGMYLSVFRRKNWVLNASVLDQAALSDSRIFSHFDNTFPHVKIFAKAFAGSKAYFSARPLSVCLTGAREWAPLYPLIRSVRLVEALDEYRKNGLPLIRYLRCKNFALKNFLPDLASLLIHRKDSGLSALRQVRLIVSSFLYPNFYFSFYHFFRKLKSIIVNGK